MTDSDREDNDKNVIRSITSVRPEQVEHITPPEGTDVRAVQGRDDSAPVAIGELEGNR
jgi:hypothetical protein